jgi:GntR family transcriptional regulator
MLIDIDVHGGVPIYRQVIEQVRRLILTGQMAEGEQLESVANLSSRVKVNPMTISKAYGFLVQDGLVERRRGVDLFVATLPDDTEKDKKITVLAEALRKAASLAVLMDVSEQEAKKLLTEQFTEINSQKERKPE